MIDDKTRYQRPDLTPFITDGVLHSALRFTHQLDRMLLHSLHPPPKNLVLKLLNPSLHILFSLHLLLEELLVLQQRSSKRTMLIRKKRMSLIYKILSFSFFKNINSPRKKILRAIAKDTIKK